MIIEQQVKIYQQKILERLKATNLTWEEACEMGIAARNLRDLSNWVIGQIAFHVQIKWGEKSMADFAKILGFQRQTVEQYRWVIKQFGEEYRPTEGLPWSFYRLAAGTKNPKETINKIIDEGYSYHTAQKFVKGLPVSKDCQHTWEDYNFMKCTICGLMLKKPPETK